jgi:HAD superfamily hydrolase (TIGR01509 family)
VTIKAVVFDIGSVLEKVDDTLWPGPWEPRLGLQPGGFQRAVAEHDLGGEVMTGEVSEMQLRNGWQRIFDLDDATAAELMADMWDWYCGELDQELFAFFSGLRTNYKTGILSNSGDGARREEQRRYGFEDVTDTIVYSHEVGMMKPQPEIYALTCERLAVEPREVVFLDDVEGHVAAARALGWHGVVHRSTPESIRAIEEILQRTPSA